jgi:transketolase
MTTLTSTRLGFRDLPELLTRLTGDEKHDRSALSTLDVLWVLYDRILQEDDRFLLSKGHGPAAYYAVLAAKGLIPEAALDDFGAFDSILGHHPDRRLVPGVEISSGSLGHGLPIAVGVALAARPTFVLVGDGELDEGSVWEAVALAGHLAPPGLRLIVDGNGFQGLGRVGEVLSLEPLAEKFRAFGWVVSEVDGHHHAALACALGAPARRPVAIVARTVKGYGVPALEGEFMSHYRSFRPHERGILFAGLDRLEEAA